LGNCLTLRGPHPRRTGARLAPCRATAGLPRASSCKPATVRPPRASRCRPPCACRHWALCASHPGPPCASHRRALLATRASHRLAAACEQLPAACAIAGPFCSLIRERLTWFLDFGQEAKRNEDACQHLRTSGPGYHTASR
jgi:hypothetical protein